MFDIHLILKHKGLAAADRPKRRRNTHANFDFVFYNADCVWRCFNCSSKCCLNSMRVKGFEVVGANGFEPSTSWSRTGESKNLKPCGCRTYKPCHPKNPALVGPFGIQACEVIRKPGSAKASDVCDTQAEAIESVEEIEPNAVILVERVRNTDRGPATSGESHKSSTTRR